MNPTSTTEGSLGFGFCLDSLSNHPLSCSLGTPRSKVVTFPGHDYLWTNNGHSKIKRSIRFGQLKLCVGLLKCLFEPLPSQQASMEFSSYVKGNLTPRASPVPSTADEKVQGAARRRATTCPRCRRRADPRCPPPGTPRRTARRGTPNPCPPEVEPPIPTNLSFGSMVHASGKVGKLSNWVCSLWAPVNPT